MGQQTSRIRAAMVGIAAAGPKRRMLTAPAAGMAPPMKRGSTLCTLACALEYTQIRNQSSLATYLTGDAGLAEPEIVAGCIHHSYYEARGMDDETMECIKRRLTPAQQMRRIFTLREHQASPDWELENNFRACSCNSLIAMLPNDVRVESMFECRYGPPCLGRGHIIALDKDKVVESVDGWISYCRQHNLPTWACNVAHSSTNRGTSFHCDQGDVEWVADKIKVPTDSPLAIADFVVPTNFGSVGQGSGQRQMTGNGTIHTPPVDLSPEKLQLAELHNDGVGNNGRMYATTVVHSEVLDMDITVHIPLVRRGILPLQRLTPAARARKMADIRALVDEIRRPGAATYSNGTPKMKRTDPTIRADAWQVTPKAMELAKKVMWADGPGNTGFLFGRGSVTDRNEVLEVAKRLHGYLFDPHNGRAKKLGENMLRDLRADADEHNVPWEKVTPQLIRAAWAGRHVAQPNDLESFLFPDRAVIATAPMPEMNRSTTITPVFADGEVEGFGGATNFILERLHEMGTCRGCQFNWGGDDGEVPDAPPALQNNIWSELWFHSSNMWNLQRRN